MVSKSIGIWFATTLEILRLAEGLQLLRDMGESQLSIFRCWLSQREREKWWWELEKILAAEDNLLLTGFVIVWSGCKYNRPDAWPVRRRYTELYNARMFGCELK